MYEMHCSLYTVSASWIMLLYNNCAGRLLMHCYITVCLLICTGWFQRCSTLAHSYFQLLRCCQQCGYVVVSKLLCLHAITKVFYVVVSTMHLLLYAVANVFQVDVSILLYTCTVAKVFCVVGNYYSFYFYFCVLSGCQHILCTRCRRKV